MFRLSLRSLRTACFFLGAAALLTACGDGSGTAAAPTSTTVSGSVVKGPVAGSTVCAFKTTPTGKGEQIKCTTTDSVGAYSMDLAYVGDVVIEAVGGTYTDEATRTTKTLADAMQVVIASQGGATVGVITPLTSAAYSISKTLTGGVTSVNFATAATSVATQFQLSGVNLATTAPVFGETANAYGKMLRAISQYVANENPLSTVLTFSSVDALQAGFASAYATINGSSLTFTFTAATGTGGGSGGGSSGGNKTLVVTVNVSGVSSTITVNNVPAPASQSDFCSGLAADSTFSSIGTNGGGSLTINSCSFSGNTGNVAATLNLGPPTNLTLPYTITYAYQ